MILAAHWPVWMTLITPNHQCTTVLFRNFRYNAFRSCPTQKIKALNDRSGFPAYEQYVLTYAYAAWMCHCAIVGAHPYLPALFVPV